MTNRFSAAPARVRFQGTDLPQLSQSGFEAAASGWHHDAASGFLQVKVQHAGGTGQLDF